MFRLALRASRLTLLGAMAITSEIVSFGGWENNLALSNEACELLITLDVGPRILSFALNGKPNVFKVFKDQTGTTGEDLWMSRGGHRLWLAPESYPHSYYPDNDSVDYTLHPNGGVTLIATDEMPQGFSKQMDVNLDPDAARVRVVHRIVNVVDEEQEVAPWALSVMAPGGTAILPQPRAHAHPGLGPGDFAPNRRIIAWPFTDLSDSRFHLGVKYATVSHDAKKSATKIGFDYPMPWAGYHNGDMLFVKRFGGDPNASYPDLNSRVEVFANEEILELETLGPLVKLKPGGVVEWVEEWELFDNVPAFNPTNQAAIADALKGLEL